MKTLLAPWQSIWSNRRLIVKLTSRKIESQHRGSVMGFLWMILDPLLILGIYLFVFGYIFEGSFKGGESRLEYGITIFVGLSIFRMFSEIMGTTSQAVCVNRNYVKKIVFPLEILPIIEIASAFYSFLIMLGLILLGQVFSGGGFSLHILWLPFVLATLWIFMTGIGWFFSSITVYFPDLSHVTQFFSIATLFGSAVFYPVSKIPDTFWAILKFNPLLHLIESARRVTMWNSSPNIIALSLVFVSSLTVFYCGYYLFVGLKKGFADVL